MERGGRLGHLAMDYFANLFSTSHSRGMETILTTLQPKVTSFMNVLCYHQILLLMNFTKYCSNNNQWKHLVQVECPQFLEILAYSGDLVMSKAYDRRHMIVWSENFLRHLYYIWASVLVGWHWYYLVLAQFPTRS